MKIALVQKSELDDVMKIIADSIKIMQEEGSDQWDEKYPTRARFLEDIEKKNLYGVYNDHNNLMGFASINEEQSKEYEQFSWQKDTYMAIHRMAVSPSYRGKGVATQLMQYGEKLANERKKEEMRCDTYKKNIGMQQLFEKMGYQYIGDTDFAGHNKEEHFQVYEKTL